MQNTINNYENPQQHFHSRHAELDSASSETLETTMKIHNNSQQTAGLFESMKPIKRHHE